MVEISPSTQHLVQRYQAWYQSLQPKEGVSTIHVDEVASRVASFYEKIRGVVEYREEHLLRKTAIERILKRRLLLKREGSVIAEPFVTELIRGGHFPNDAIEESKIEDTQRIIDKYVFILENAPAPEQAPASLGVKSRGQLYNWIIGIAACETEEILAPPLKEQALMDYMLELMKERVKVKNEMPEDEIEIQLYIAIQKAVFRLDPPIVSYRILSKKLPDWKLLSPKIEEHRERLEKIAKNIYLIWENLEKKFHHPLAGKFYEVCEKYDTPYLILNDIILQSPLEAPQLLENPENLESKIKEAYQGRLKRLKSRMGRAAFFSVISIFITKVLLALLVEVPFDRYVVGEFSYFSLGLNIAIPPVLMFFLILSTRPPQKSNLQRAEIEVMKIVYQKEKKDVYEIRPSKKRGMVLNAAVGFLYFLNFVIAFGVIIWLLNKINFSILSQVIFIIFFCLIASAGVKIRETAKELIVEEKREALWRGLIDTFALPVLQMGRWLSSQWAKYNLVVVFLNSLVDMPFQVFVEFFEHWRSFLKEKKEEMH